MTPNFSVLGVSEVMGGHPQRRNMTKKMEGRCCLIENGRMTEVAKCYNDEDNDSKWKYNYSFYHCILMALR